MSVASPGNIVTLPPVTPTGTQGGSIDWQAQLPQGADFVRLANWTPNSLLIHLAGDTHNLDPWTADVYPAYCRMGLQYTQLAVSPAAGLPTGSTATIIVTVAYGVQIPGIYPLPLPVSGFVIDTTAGDIKPVGTVAAAGAVGKGADAGHIHPIAGGGALDAAAADIKPVGTAAAAGAVGLAADAGHVHDIAGGGALDAAAADIKDLAGGDAASVAGAVGLAADSGHQHPARTEGTVSTAARGTNDVRMGVNGTAAILVLEDNASHVCYIYSQNGIIYLAFLGVTHVSIDTTGKIAADGGVGLDTVDHYHPHSALHHHSISTVEAFHNSGGGIQGTSGTLATLDHYHQVGADAIYNTADVSPGNTDNESVKHTHKG